MKSLQNLICILAVVSTAFAADEWLNYSNPFPINQAINFGEGFLMATDGGVRYRANDADDMYTTSTGLGDQSVSAVVPYGSDVYAVCENGVISKIEPGKPWEQVSRSYAGSSLHLKPGMARVAGTTMVLAFEDRIAFFSLENKTSILTIEKIRDKSLASGIGAMEIQGDSLFVALGKNLYVRKMDWDNLESDVRLNDPESWSVFKDGYNENGIKSIAWKDDKIKTFSTEGTRIWDDDGETSVSLDTFSVMSSSAPLVKIRGKAFKDSALYERDSVTRKVGDSLVVERYYYRTRFQWVRLLSSKRAILAGSNDILYYDGKKFSNLTGYATFPIRSVYELRALPTGGVIAASENGYFSRFDGRSWSDPVPALYGLGNNSDARAHNMKVLSVNSKKNVFYHVWGFGYMLYTDWGESLDYKLLANDGHCMSSYLDSQPYVITISTTPAPDGNGFLTTSASNKGGYSLVYVDLDGNVSCADSIGYAPIGGPMLASIDENSGDWVVYIGTRDGPTLTAEGGLDVVSFPPPKSTGGELSSKITKNSVKHYYGISSTPLDMVYEPKSEYIWLVTESSLAYWNKEQDSLRSPLSTNGLTSASFSSIDADRRGNLWVGTASQGAYRLTPRETSPDTLSVLHITTRQGLLSDRIQDVAVDSTAGLVWFAHENGVSGYYRNDLRGTEGNMTDDARAEFKVYPNPFRPSRHPYVFFDNISADAVINIYNRGGKLVMSLRGDRVAGGKTEWDGRLDDGSLVAPGVYQYVVRSGSKVRKGKLLIIH